MPAPGSGLRFCKPPFINFAEVWLLPPAVVRDQASGA
jgi:hypothetical protein